MERRARNRFALIIILPLLSLILINPAAAYLDSGHLTLLTVAETGNPLDEGVGGTADVYLQIKPGTGQIFIDSFPLTQLDTQSSTRYANQVACSYLGVDCSQYDFFYTIRANSTVVGGPSAGAAMAVLTASLLAGVQPDDSIAITGTINSGGIVGPVAGIKQKVQAAKARGLRLVLISAFSYPTEVNASYLAELNRTRTATVNRSLIDIGNASNGSGAPNVTVNLSLLFTAVNTSALGIPVEQVSTLQEALAIFTHRTVSVQPPPPLIEDAAYTRIMQGVAADLCGRRDTAAKELDVQGLNATLPDAANRTAQEAAVEKSGDWYSLASYCFSDLIDLRTRLYANLTPEQRTVVYRKTMSDIATFERNLESRNLTTLADLETYLIVEERLKEARDMLITANQSDISAADLAFAVERYNSANSWSAFFQLPSPPYTVDEAHLAAACTEKQNQADEQINYVELYLPDNYLSEARQELQASYGDSQSGDYAFCLFQASKAQALADLLAGSLSVPKDKVGALVNEKLDAVETVLAQQEAHGHFPILGYSYYRYARSLAASDPYSALTFAEYSLELSDIDLYFPQRHGFRLPVVDPYLVVLFLSGVLLGGALGAWGMVRIVKKDGSDGIERKGARGTGSGRKGLSPRRGRR